MKIFASLVSAALVAGMLASCKTTSLDESSGSAPKDIIGAGEPPADTAILKAYYRIGPNLQDTLVRAFGENGQNPICFGKVVDARGVETIALLAYDDCRAQANSTVAIFPKAILEDLGGSTAPQFINSRGFLVGAREHSFIRSLCTELYANRCNLQLKNGEFIICSKENPSGPMGCDNPDWMN